MTHISRPFQIALAAVVLLAGVWFIALRGHTPSGESSGSSSSGPSAAASSASTPATGSAASQNGSGGAKASAGKAYHGSAPGVAGLTRAIDKAQGAVKQSEQNARQLQQKAAQASGSTQANGAQQAQQAQQTSAQPSSSAHSTSSTPSSSAGAKHATPAPATAPAHAKAPAAASKPSRQALVEGELKHGRTVIVLFWSPRGSVDVAVRRQLATLPQSRSIAVHYSSAGEVGQYGTITRSLQVLQTPTMLVISPSGKTKTLTGLVDAYAIRQAIREARHS